MKYKTLYDVVPIRYLPYIADYATPLKVRWFSCTEYISEAFMDFKEKKKKRYT